MSIENIFDKCLAQIISLEVLYTRLKTEFIVDLSSDVIDSRASQSQPDLSMEQFTAHCVIKKRVKVVGVRNL